MFFKFPILNIQIRLFNTYFKMFRVFTVYVQRLFPVVQLLICFQLGAGHPVVPHVCRFRFASLWFVGLSHVLASGVYRVPINDVLPPLAHSLPSLVRN